MYEVNPSSDFLLICKTDDSSSGGGNGRVFIYRAFIIPASQMAMYACYLIHKTYMTYHLLNSLFLYFL